ncbi:FtsX-like permease family protein [Arcanobacterium hippocoleae]
MQAIAVGIIGSLIGLLFGQGLLVLIRNGLDRFGMPMSGSQFVEFPTALLAVCIGTLITILATLLPSRRAAKIAPIEAMRDVGGQHEKPLKVRGIIFAVLSVIAYTMLGGGAVKGNGWLFGIGAGLAVISLIGLMPVLVHPVVAILGWPVRKLSRGIGEIASRSLTSLPRKTATTSVALAIGIMLVTAGSTIAVSLQKQIEGEIDSKISADLIVISNGPISDISHSAALLEKITGIAKVDSSLRYGMSQLVEVDGKQIDPVTRFAGTLSADVVNEIGIRIVAGDARKALEAGEAIYVKTAQDAAKVNIGSEITVLGNSAPVQARVGAIAEFGTLRLALLDLILPQTLADRLQPFEETTPLMFIDADDSVPISDVKTKVQNALKEQYIWQVLDNSDVKQITSGQVSSVLTVLYALLALSVVIAVLGVVNTLTLSVMDRKSEIGLLRAVGMRRGGIRKMVLYESVLSTLLGAVTGIAAGIAIGLALVRYIGAEDAVYLIPWNALIVVFAGAFAVGIFASLLPARKAARTNVLEAIADE